MEPPRNHAQAISWRGRSIAGLSHQWERTAPPNDREQFTVRQHLHADVCPRSIGYAGRLSTLSAICWMARRSPCSSRPFTRSADRRARRGETGGCRPASAAHLMFAFRKSFYAPSGGGAGQVRRTTDVLFRMERSNMTRPPTRAASVLKADEATKQRLASAAASSRAGHRMRRSDRAGQHRRWGRGR